MKLCVASLLLLSAASAAPLSKKYPFPRDLPFIGKGECGEVVKGEDGYSRVTCYGPREQLAPGETRNVMMELADPYAGNELFAVVNMTAQMVDDDQQAVPLSEVYCHHYVSSNRLLLGSGAELRGSFTRAPLAWPLTLEVNGTETALDETRMTNLQLINTVGVAAADMRACLECWCEDSADPATGLATRGSFLCCKDCPSASDAGAKGYRLQYSVTYRSIAEAVAETNAEAEVVGFLGFDVTGGEVEYNLLEPLGPNSTHIEAYETVFDKHCPQEHSLTVVRCTAHQHVGSQCLSVFNLDKDNELICRSCPVYGTEEGVAGNEAGYVVAITDDNVSYEVAPGTRIRLESAYDGSERRLGLMGLMSMWVTGLDESTCKGRFGHSYGYAGHLALSGASTTLPQQPELISV